MRSYIRILAGFLILCLLLPFIPSRAEAQLLSNPVLTNSGPGSSTLSLEIPAGAVSDDYILGAGDRLDTHLIVGDNAMVLDYAFVINPEGKIFFPNVSEIDLAGLTLKDAKKTLIRAIRKKFKERFELSLMVSVPKKISIYITGQADNPGLYEVYDGTRMSDVLKAVGVAKGGSDLTEYVYLKRKTDNHSFENYKLSLHDIFLENDGKLNMLVERGDIIAIPAIKSYVYIYGEIARSGTMGYVPSQTLSDYINLAGGPTQRADLSSVTITRQENGEAKIYHVDASQILHRGQSEKDIEIFAGDVINVPANFFYFHDFASLANTILLGLTLLTAVSARL